MIKEKIYQTAKVFSFIYIIILLFLKDDEEKTFERFEILNKKVAYSEQSYYSHLMDIINRKKDKSLKEKEKLEKFKVIRGENEIKAVSEIVEKLHKQEKIKEYIFDKKNKEEKQRKSQWEEKRNHFIEIKKKIKNEDKEKLNDIKDKLQRIELNLSSKKVSFSL